MDLKLKTCSRKTLRPSIADRLTSLPDELLGRILSTLPTKDVAATAILCKRMREGLCWISSIDLDDSPISHCSQGPYLIERFPMFQSFVNNLLQKFPDNTHITRFRLHFGGDVNTHYHHDWDYKPRCLPDVLPSLLKVWISRPLAHYDGLKELDLSFHVTRPFGCEIPASLFACQSLQVLRLASNVDIDDANIRLIHLPNLKLLHLNNLVFKDDDFVARLVLSCPILQDLSINLCLWRIGNRLSISSPSLRSLVFIVRKDCYNVGKSKDLVLLDTPNLQYLHYDDYVATCYSIAPMNALVKASIDICDYQDGFEAELSLVRAMSHVQDLSLCGYIVKNFYYAGEIWNHLPVFRNLRSLQLDALSSEGRWDVILLLILHRLPSLETLIFVRGLFRWNLTVCAGATASVEMAALEAEGWRTAADAIPSCCLTHLKRIVFKRCFGSDRELNTIKFLLANSLVLEELVICLSINPIRTRHLDLFENAVNDLSRASSSCLVTLQRIVLKVIVGSRGLRCFVA